MTKTLRSTYTAAQIVAGIAVFSTVTAGRAVWIGADYAVQGLRKKGRT